MNAIKEMTRYLSVLEAAHGNPVTWMLITDGTDIRSILPYREAVKANNISVMAEYLPVLENLEAEPELWLTATDGTGIATLAAYRSACGGVK